MLKKTMRTFSSRCSSKVLRNAHHLHVQHACISSSTSGSRVSIPIELMWQNNITTRGKKGNLWNTARWNEVLFGQRMGRKVKYGTERNWNNDGFSQNEIIISFSPRIYKIYFKSLSGNWYYLKGVAHLHKISGISWFSQRNTVFQEQAFC